MLLPDFVWKRGDTGSALAPTLTYAKSKDGHGRITWAPMDLTGATVTLTMSARVGDAVPVLSAVPVNVIGDPKAGNVSYIPNDGVATATAGFYVAEFKIVDQFTKVWYWPSPLPLIVQVAERVAP